MAGRLLLIKCFRCCVCLCECDCADAALPAQELNVRPAGVEAPRMRNGEDSSIRSHIVHAQHAVDAQHAVTPVQAVNGTQQAR